MRWFEKHLPKDGSVRIHRFDQTLVGLSIAGPNSQALLQKLVDEDVSTKAFRFMDFREMAVGGAPCMVNRVTYTGDLGYEIWMQPAYQRLVYKAIKEAGEEFGIVDFGMRALLSMRLEKNFPTWFRELGRSTGRSRAPWTASSSWRRTTSSAATPRQGAGGRPEAAARLVRGRGDRRRRDGRRADLGQGRRARLRHGRKAARLRRATLRRRRQGGARLDCRHGRLGGARHHRRRVAGGRLGHVGRLCPPCRQVAGAGLCAGGTGRG